MLARQKNAQESNKRTINFLLIKKERRKVVKGGENKGKARTKCPGKSLSFSFPGKLWEIRHLDDIWKHTRVENP